MEAEGSLGIAGPNLSFNRLEKWDAEKFGDLST